MAGVRTVDVAPVARQVPLLNPNCGRFGQASAILSQPYQFANSLKTRRIGTTSFGNWHAAQRGRVVISRDEGLGARNNWPLWGQCRVASFCQQASRSRSWKVKRNVQVRCEGESASTFSDVATYSEGEGAPGQGGGDGVQREMVSPIALENSLASEDVFQTLLITEGLSAYFNF